MEEEPVEAVVGVRPGDEVDLATEEGEEVAGAVEAVASVQLAEVLEGVIQTSRELVALVEEGVRSTYTSVWAEGLGSSGALL